MPSRSRRRVPVGVGLPGGVLGAQGRFAVSPGFAQHAHAVIKGLHVAVVQLAVQPFQFVIVAGQTALKGGVILGAALGGGGFQRFLLGRGFQLFGGGGGLELLLLGSRLQLFLHRGSLEFLLGWCRVQFLLDRGCLQGGLGLGLGRGGGRGRFRCRLCLGRGLFYRFGFGSRDSGLLGSVGSGGRSSFAGCCLFILCRFHQDSSFLVHTRTRCSCTLG